ncbi:MAG: hypothetical protein JEY91_08315 [Spirochaetaceae bacterium]|nr:hypothetical protein [Spirochaetaceae bacterium]
MKKLLTFILLTLTITLFADANSTNIELEGIWALPGVDSRSFFKANQHVFIERVNSTSIYVYWENAYFGEKDYLVYLEYDDEKNQYIGKSSDNKKVILAFPQDVDFSDIISIGIEGSDERYSFIPFPYDEAK